MESLPDSLSRIINFIFSLKLPAVESWIKNNKFIFPKYSSRCFMIDPRWSIIRGGDHHSLKVVTVVFKHLGSGSLDLLIAKNCLVKSNPINLFAFEIVIDLL